MSDETLTKDKIMRSFRKRNIFQKIWSGLQYVTSRLVIIWKKIPPHSKFKKGAAWGAAIITIFLAVLWGIFFRPGIWQPIDVPAGILMILFLTLVISLMAGIVFGVISGIITVFSWRGWMAMVAFVFLFMMLKAPFPIALIIGVIIVSIEAILGGLIAYCFTSEFKFGTWIKKGVVILSILAVMAVNFLTFKWILNPGSESEFVKLKNRGSNQLKISAGNTIDPSRDAAFQVIKISYGSGNHTRRPEFGKEADLKTKTVNLEPFLKENSGWKRKHRRLYWKFDWNAFPLNGTVWFPSGEGLHPLVLMVHGNYRMEWTSDQGLAYLGKYLAGRGFVSVAIDENALNDSWSGELHKEIDARAWLILQHLELWKKWNETRGNPFYQKVDMNHIGLLGHDSGAAAIARASVFNRIKRYPGDGRIEFDFNFDIGSLAVIAPVSGKSESGSPPPLLMNHNLLCIQGVQDALSSGRWGTALFDGMSFRGDQYRFKSFITTYRSNHSQFNSVWGSSDYRFPYNLFSNRKLLLDQAGQKRICSVFTTLFFESTLKKNPDYIPVFHNPGRYARWLPDDYFVSRFEDSRSHFLCTYQEDFDPSTGTAPGIAIQGKNLSIWQETENRFSGFTDNPDKLAVIGWRDKDTKTGEAPRYTITISEENNPFSADLANSALTFAIADASELFPPKGKSATDFPVADFSIEITSKNQKELISASACFTPPLPMKRTPSKLNFIEEIISGEDCHLMLQTVEIPFSFFFKGQSEIEPEEITSISFIFNHSKNGVILLDNIGLVPVHHRKPEPAAPDQRAPKKAKVNKKRKT